MAKRRPWTARRIQRLLIAKLPELVWREQSDILRTAYRLSAADRFRGGASITAACETAAEPTTEPHEATIRCALRQNWFSR